MAKQRKWSEERKQAARDAYKARQDEPALGEPVLVTSEGITLVSELAPAPVDKLDQILEAMGALTARVAAVESSTPTFTAQQRPEKAADRLANTYRPPESLAEAKKHLTRDGQLISGITNDELRDQIQAMKPEDRPIFGPGSRVRVNPDALIFGSDAPADADKPDDPERPITPRFWRDVLKIRNSDGVGTVSDISLITKSYEPKYKVKVPGLTGLIGDGFRESELLPA